MGVGVVAFAFAFIVSNSHARLFFKTPDIRFIDNVFDYQGLCGEDLRPTGFHACLYDGGMPVIFTPLYVIFTGGELRSSPVTIAPHILLADFIG